MSSGDLPVVQLATVSSRLDYNNISLPIEGQWTIYGTNWCPHTIAAVTLLHQLGKKYKYYDISENKQLIYKAMSKYSKKTVNTVPIIFNKQKQLIVGGNAGLKSCHRKDRTLGICE